MAIPPKGKEPASDSIMTPGKMKPILAISKQEPVQAAIGLTTDGEGLILLHKKMKPKKVLATLRAEAAKAKLQLNGASLRFGRALVDTDYDPGMVRFFVNKDAPGNMRVKLLEVVKRIPYQKVEINVDPSLEDEPEDETQAQAPAAPPAGSAAAPVPPAPPPAPAAPPDPATVRRVLMALAGRIAPATGDDAAKRGALLALANQANDALKAGDTADAAKLLAQLKKDLDEAAPTGKAGPVLPLWNEAKEAVDVQLNELYAKLKQTGLPVLAKVAGEIETVLINYRTGLVTVLMDYDRAAGSEKAAARDGALKVIADYKTRLSGDKHITAADTNPFKVTVTARTTLGDALTRLESHLQAA